MTQLNIEEVLELLEECVEDKFYFEIGPDAALTLLDYINNLECAVEDDRGIL